MNLIITLHVYSVFCRQKFKILPAKVCELPSDVLNIIGRSDDAGKAFKVKSYIFIPRSFELNSNLVFISPALRGKYSKLNSPFDEFYE